MDRHHPDIIALIKRSGRTEKAFFATAHTVVEWLPLIELERGSYRMGLSGIGYWLVESKGKALLLETPTSYVAALPVLEIEPTLIDQQIERNAQSSVLENFAKKWFPIDDIIRAAIEQESEYWASLALEWFTKMPAETRQTLSKHLIVIKSSKWASQMLRHRVIKELRGFTGQDVLG